MLLTLGRLTSEEITESKEIDGEGPTAAGTALWAELEEETLEDTSGSAEREIERDTCMKSNVCVCAECRYTHTHLCVAAVCVSLEEAELQVQLCEDEEEPEAETQHQHTHTQMTEEHKSCDSPDRVLLLSLLQTHCSDSCELDSDRWAAEVCGSETSHWRMMGVSACDWMKLGFCGTASLSCDESTSCGV